MSLNLIQQIHRYTLYKTNVEVLLRGHLGHGMNDGKGKVSKGRQNSPPIRKKLSAKLTWQNQW